MSNALQLIDAHNLLIEVIADDLATVEDNSLAGVSFARLEDHDPLGIAFYVYAMQRTGYTHIALNTLPEIAKFWVEDKVSSGDLFPYIDRELSAISLTTFTLCKFKKSCPKVSGYPLLALQYFDDNKGLFNNFFTTAMVGLGLQALEPAADLNQRLNTYLTKQFRDHSNVILNDSKNFLAAHLWAREYGCDEVISKLVNESLERSRQTDCTPRDLVYYTYVLMEEVEKIPRDDREEVRKFTEASLLFLKDYSHEVAFPSDVLEEFTDDISLSSTFIHSQTFTVRPRLSRIMLSIGLLIDRLYEKNAPLFFTRAARFNRLSKGWVYPIALFLLAGFIVWAAWWVGLPFNLKNTLNAKHILPPPVLLCLAFLANLSISFVVVALIIFALQIFTWLVIQSKPLDESVLRERLIESFNNNWKWEIVPALAAALFGSLSS